MAERPGRSFGAAAAASELRATVSLAMPIVAVQVGMMAMGTIDTMMAGRVSARVLAAVALGNLYFFNISVFALGTLMALDPLVSQALGARDRTAASNAIQRALVLAAGLSILLMLLFIPVRPVLANLGQPAEIVGDAAAYVHICIPGVVPFLVFGVLRQSLQAMHRVAPVVWTILLANLLNAGLNWVFVFGNLGSPPLGAAGSAIATSISRWAMAIGLLVAAWRYLSPSLTSFTASAFELRPLRGMVSLGAPIGMQHALEAGAFGAIGLMMGNLGTNLIAAHQVAINLAALTFMVPLGVAGAAAVRVGHAIGAGDEERVRAASRAAYICGVGFMCATAVVFLLAPRQLAALFTRDHDVLLVAAALIPIAGAFQVFDGAQAVGAGVLRGMGDTRIPLLVMLASYWLLGVPVSAYLGFRTGLGAVGLWWGFVLSLAAVAVFLYLRIRVLLGRKIERTRI